MISKNLSVLAYSNGFTIWHYKSPDAAEKVESGGYFAPVAGIFNAGDIIFISFGDGDGRRSAAYTTGPEGSIGRMK